MKFFVTDIIKAGSDDENAPIGTKKAGYASPDDGPFMCGHCIHYKEVDGKEGRCNHPKVVADPEMEKDDNDKAIVMEGGCCNMFNPGGY